MIPELITIFLGTSEIFILCVIFFIVVTGFFIWKYNFKVVTKLACSSTLFGVFCAWASSYSTYTQIFFPGMFPVVVSFLMGIALIIVGLIAVYLYKEVLFPLNNLMNESKELSKGDLTIDMFNWTKKDEIGSLVLSFQTMKHELRRIIENINQFSSSVSTSAQEFASASQEINASAEEIASISQYISARSTNQTTDVKETIELINKIEKYIELKTNDVNKASVVIEMLSNQVNMLSLNASIEAARAGEYGKGFGVVAQNIKYLSENTKESLVEVSHAITSLKEEIRSGFDELTRTITALVTLSSQNTAECENVSAATEEQVASIEEMSANAQELANLSSKLEQSVNSFKIY